STLFPYTTLFRSICTNILQIPIKFTSEIEAFVADEGMKLSYGRQALGNEVFVQSVELLLEQGLSDIEIKMQDWEGTPCFVALAESSAIHFDIFAGTVYFRSRDEEYMPHVKDHQGRFPATESLAYQEGFLEMPIVDVWAYKFKDILHKHYPEEIFSSREFKTRNII